MIPEAAITAWGVSAPWPTRAQVEQDLLLSRLIVELASHPYLRDEMIFRGGTCLHKLHLTVPHRYSEDLDYVRATAGGIQPLTQAVTNVGEALGFEVRTQMGAQPKVYLRTTATSGELLRIKVEVNTYERTPALPLTRVRHDVRSSCGQAQYIMQPVDLSWKGTSLLIRGDAGGEGASSPTRRGRGGSGD